MVTCAKKDALLGDAGAAATGRVAKKDLFLSDAAVLSDAAATGSNVATSGNESSKSSSKAGTGLAAKLGGCLFTAAGL